METFKKTQKIETVVSPGQYEAEKKALSGMMEDWQITMDWINAKKDLMLNTHWSKKAEDEIVALQEQADAIASNMAGYKSFAKFITEEKTRIANRISVPVMGGIKGSQQELDRKMKQLEGLQDMARNIANA